ncbi:MAG TPA: alpha-ketoacid dehydrogenase subunit beta [Candidatus Acidoferrales bacterium]|nr:alpha-ketoacid dehydrogenase subunit beta [Candidatus Acidoferrales bacterium]
MIETTTAETLFGKALNWTITTAMETDPNVFVIGEDIGQFGGAFGITKGLVEKFGKPRVLDTPISEAGLVGVGVGAAMMGMRPIVEIQFSDFLVNAMDQIVNQAAKVHFMFGGNVNVPIVIRTPFGGGVGLAAQHSQSLEAWFYHVPGLKVVAPSTPDDARGLLFASIDDPNPVIFFEHKLLYSVKGPMNESIERIPLGKAVVRRPGTDATVVSYSFAMHRTLEAAEKLAAKGIDLEVIDLRTLYPLDIETVIASVERTGRLAVCHEAVIRGGIGGDIIAQVCSSRTFSKLKGPVLRIGAKESPVPYSPPLESYVLPSAEHIESELQTWLK